MFQQPSEPLSTFNVEELINALPSRLIPDEQHPDEDILNDDYKDFSLNLAEQTEPIEVRNKSIGSIWLSNSIFEADIRFINCSIRQIQIDNVQFKGVFKINGSCTIDSSELLDNEKAVQIKDADFQDTLEFESNKLIESYTFIKEFSIEESELKHLILRETSFKDKMRVKGTDIEEIDLFNTKFFELADFYGCHFKCTVIFNKTDFYNILVLSACTFEKNVLFTYTLLQELTILRNAKFKNGIDLSMALIRGQINTHLLHLKHYRKTKPLPLLEKDFRHGIHTSGIIFHHNQRETYRILKETNQSQSNFVEATKYHSHEHKTLLIEKVSDLGLPIRKWCYIKTRKNAGKKIADSARFDPLFSELTKWTSSFSDLIILLYNWCTNSFGRYWIQGMVTTLLIGLFFFQLSYNAVHPDGCFIFGCEYSLDSFHYEEFFTFLNPAHETRIFTKLDLNDYNKPYYIFEFLGRIFVSIGIYQIIQAFRKFKK